MVAVQIAFDFSHVLAGRPADNTPVQDASDTPRIEPRRARLPRTVQREVADGSIVTAQSQHTEQRVLAAALEETLRARVAVPLRLTITDNRRTMLSLRRHAQFVEVRLHHMFLQADARTRDALSDYLFESDRGAAQQIARYIEQHRQRIRRVGKRPPALSTAGAHHDLAAIFRAVNQHYFDNRVDIHITWGRDARARPRGARRSIKLGSYTSRERLVRVHPALDAAFVPRFFVEYIVYHEMLHHVLPPKTQRGRRDLHGPTFKARERQFVEYDAALQWERENLDRLLRNRRIRRARATVDTHDA
jgi:predicted metal-dependent hydrolase